MCVCVSAICLVFHFFTGSPVQSTPLSCAFNSYTHIMRTKQTAGTHTKFQRNTVNSSNTQVNTTWKWAWKGAERVAYHLARSLLCKARRTSHNQSEQSTLVSTRNVPLIPTCIVRICDNMYGRQRAQRLR